MKTNIFRQLIGLHSTDVCNDDSQKPRESASYAKAPNAGELMVRVCKAAPSVSKVYLDYCRLVL